MTLVLFIILPAPILATGESVPPKPVTTEVPTVHLKITIYFLCLCSDIFPAIPAEDFLGAQGADGVAGILSPISSQPVSLHMITSGLKMFKGTYNFIDVTTPGFRLQKSNQINWLVLHV